MKKFLTTLRAKRAHQKRKRGTVPYRQAKSFGILFTEKPGTQHTWPHYLRKMLEADGKKVAMLAWQPQLEGQEGAKPDEYGVFSFKDISRLGEFKNPDLKEFSDTAFDYLLHLDMEMHWILKVVLQHSQAKCRVGAFLGTTETEAYECMFAEKSGSAEGLVNQMYHYLKQF